MREIIIIITAVCSHQLYGIDSISSLTLRSFIKNIKEHKERSVLFIKNTKERENVAFFWKERIPNPAWQWCRPSTPAAGPLFYDYNPSDPLWIRFGFAEIFACAESDSDFLQFFTSFFLQLKEEVLQNFWHCFFFCSWFKA